jgi:hypothetical protein
MPLELVLLFRQIHTEGRNLPDDGERRKNGQQPSYRAGWAEMDKDPDRQDKKHCVQHHRYNEAKKVTTDRWTIGFAWHDWSPLLNDNYTLHN